MVTRVSHWLLIREHGLRERNDYESVAGYCKRDGLLRNEIQTRSGRGTLFEWDRRFCEPADGQWKVVVLFSVTVVWFPDPSPI